MVSKARLDLPDPESPVMTTRRSRGISTSMFFRLCSRAPLTTILSRGIALLQRKTAYTAGPQETGTTGYAYEDRTNVRMLAHSFNPVKSRTPVFAASLLIVPPLENRVKGFGEARLTYQDDDG